MAEAPAPHELLNALDQSGAAEALRRCCGAERWVTAMLAARPYVSTAHLQELAERCWQALAEQDYLEAFTHHPQIGEDLAALRQRFARTEALSAREQAGVLGADEATLRALRDGNQAYRERFGYIFIVCATGKSAEQMLALLRERLPHAPEQELAIAAAEQAKITRLRLAQLGQASDRSANGAGEKGGQLMSGITCHVLDTSIGKPAAGIQVRLERRSGGQAFQALGQALTNADGRVLGFEPAQELSSGEYRVCFDTATYFMRQGQPIFYPRVEVTFQVAAAGEHYHIPLLLSPYGYSTYRGS